MSLSTNDQPSVETPRPLDPEDIASTKASLAADIPAVAITTPGTFFEDANYFDSLPHQAKILIMAIQKTGPHPSRPSFCNDQGRQALVRFHQTKSTDDLEKAIALYAMAVKYMASDDPNCHVYVYALAKALQFKWETSHDPADLDATVEWYHKTVMIAGERSPVLAVYVCDVAVLLTRRFGITKNVNDFEEARANYERACALATGSPFQSVMLSNQGELLRSAISLWGRDLELATDAINLQQQAITLIGEKKNLPIDYGQIFRNAACSYHARFKITSQEEDSEQGISFFKLALRYVLTGSPAQCRFSNDLSQLYMTRYNTWNRQSDLEEAAACLRNVINADDKNLDAMRFHADLLRIRAKLTTDQEAAREYLRDAWTLLLKCVECMPSSCSTRGWVFDRCSAVCQDKFATDGIAKDLDDAVDFSRKATTSPDGADDWNFFRNLSGALLLRYEHGRKPADLHDALSAINSALSAAERRFENQGLCLWGLGKVLRAMYDDNKDPGVLGDAIDKFVAAEGLMEQDKNSRAMIRNDLGNAYCTRFEHTNLRSDMDAAVTYFKNALEDIHQTGVQSDELMVNSTLGAALLARYTYWNSEDDLNGAANYIRKSLQGINESRPSFAIRAGNLSHVLQLKSELEKAPKVKLELLREAQMWVRRALEGPIKLNPQSINVLETHMGNIYHRMGGSANFELALQHYHIALSNNDARIPYLATTSMNIASTLKVMADVTKQPEAYQRALMFFDITSQLLSENNPFQCTVRFGRAILYNDMYLGKVVPEYNEFGKRALEEFYALANETNIEVRRRIQASSVAASLMYDLDNNPAGARDILIHGVNLLPEAILLHSKRLEQLRFIREFHYLPSSAAATSLAAGETAATTIQLLERGRAVIWDRLINERTSIDDLNEADDESLRSLGKQFEQLREELFQQPTSNGQPTASIAAKDEIRIRRHHTAEQYTKLVDTIRQKEGFRDFLQLPSDLTHLQEYGSLGPVIFVNGSRYRGDALIITKEEIYSLHLPLFDMASVTRNASMFLFARNNLASNFDEAREVYEKVMKWLWDAAGKSILDSIDFSQYDTKPPDKPRVFWVSTGWVSVMPIHAAGDFSSVRATDEPRSVHERVVSSYTTSLRALAFARSQARKLKAQYTVNDQTALLVAMPTTPGMGAGGNLHVEPEVASVRETLAGSAVVKTLQNVRLSEVQLDLKTCCAVHFACHGVVDSEDPSKSAIRLEDWQKKALNVRALLSMNLQNCRLAYLSTCNSSLSEDLNLRDEGIHVAGAFHMAGVPHTISTLWRVDDEVSVEVASSFYKFLKGDNGVIDFECSAAALHSSVQKLRDSGVSAIFWGPYIHSGA